MEDLKSFDPATLYEKRLLLFLETEPQSNVYNQVLVNSEQLNRISDNIGVVEKSPEKNELYVFNIDLSRKAYLLPDLPSTDDSLTN